MMNDYSSAGIAANFLLAAVYCLSTILS